YAPKAIIAPHAGFIYSGAIAANAYACLSQMRDKIRRIVLLGPAHTLAFQGLAASSAQQFQTPLGLVPIDEQLQRTALTLKPVQLLDEAHTREHSLEVHLPFLQSLLANFTLLPLVVGQATPQEVAEVLQALWGGEETLIVISSDLSHYLPYGAAQQRDQHTCDSILRLDYPHLGYQDACGCDPIRGLLWLAQEIGLEGKLLDLRNSGDTAGDKQRVVGYSAWHFFPLQHYQTAYGPVLLQLARDAIRFYLQQRQLPQVNFSAFAPILQRPGATFVTLTQNGELRGCIGSLEAGQPLLTDIAHNACRAAFHDRRFAPIGEQDLPTLEVSISILSAPQPLPVSDERDLLQKLRPQVDGLIIQYQQHQGTFLPSVWQMLPEPEQFLRQLKLKAGLPADFWSDEMRVWRYTAESIKNQG
ncbi:MAG: AmmeMemoRadiSam system protein B, partial [Enterobacteriaceae bacterium]